MKKGRDLGKLMIFLFGIIFLLTFVSSATTVTLKIPASSGVVSGATVGQTLNTTFDTFTNVTSCTWYASSSSTANSTATNISSVANSSVNPAFLNFTLWDTTKLEDSNDYSVYASCTNFSSVVANSTPNTNIVIENTIPQAPTSLLPVASSTDDDGNVVFSGIVTGANTTSCLLFFVNGPNINGPVQTMTHSGNTCNLTINGIPEQTYNYIIQASDGTNRTNATSTAFNVGLQTSSNYLFQGNKNIQVNEDKSLSVASGKVPIFVIVILIIIAIAFWISRKK